MRLLCLLTWIIPPMKINFKEKDWGNIPIITFLYIVNLRITIITITILTKTFTGNWIIYRIISRIITILIIQTTSKKPKPRLTKKTSICTYVNKEFRKMTTTIKSLE